jgi:DMSO reductase anchor subunit
MALATGALWLALLASLFDLGRGLASAIAVPALLAAAGVKWAYWRDIDGAAPLARVADATGLGALGQARLLERPHTEANYLQKEMGFRVARKHAGRLRRLVLLVGLGLPSLLVLLAPTLPALAGSALVAVALLAGILGALAERWLFFAQAQHTVNLYYGADAA